MTEIHQLLARLGSSDADTAEAALARLTVLGPRAIEPLLQFYPGARPAARLQILALLERCPDSRAGDLLRGELSSPSPGLRRQAARALNRLALPRTGTILLACMQGEADPGIKSELAAMLAHRAADGAADLLDELLDLLFDQRQDPGVRRAVLACLPSLRPRDSRRLLQRLAATPTDPLADDASSLLEEASFAALHGLTQALVEPQPGSFPGSSLRLMGLGLRAVPGVLKTMEEHAGDVETSQRCVWTLAGMDTAARRNLAARMDPDWPPAVIEGVLEALAGMTDRRVVVALKNLAVGLRQRLTQEPDNSRREVLARLRARAHRLIAEGGSRLATGDLKDALSQSELLHEDLFRAFALIGTRDDLPDLLRVYRDGEPWIRHHVGAAVDQVCRREGPRRLRSLATLLAPEMLELLHHAHPSFHPRPARQAPRPRES